MLSNTYCMRLRNILLITSFKLQQSHPHMFLSWNNTSLSFQLLALKHFSICTRSENVTFKVAFQPLEQALNKHKWAKSTKAIKCEVTIRISNCLALAKFYLPFINACTGLYHHFLLRRLCGSNSFQSCMFSCFNG